MLNQAFQPANQSVDFRNIIINRICYSHCSVFLKFKICARTAGWSLQGQSAKISLLLIREQIRFPITFR